MVSIPNFIPMQEQLDLSFEEETVWIPTERFIYSLNDQGDRQRILPKDSNSSSQGNYAFVSEGTQSYLYSLKEEPLAWNTQEQVYTEHNRIFSFDMYSSITEWDSLMNKKWSRSLPSALSCIAVGSSRLVLGFIDGSIQILDDQGLLIQEYRPGGSRVEILYAVALSEDQRTISLISGLSPQRFVVLEQKQNDYRPVFHKNLSSQYRRPVLLKYLSGNNSFYFESESGVILYHGDIQKLEELTFPGSLQTMVHPESLNLPLILSKNNQGFSLYAFLNGRVFYHKDFEADYSNLISGNAQTFLILDDQVFTLKWRLQ